MNENLLKATLMIGGGYLLFMLFKPKKVQAFNSPVTKALLSETKNIDGEETPMVINSEDANIVMRAYINALKAGESPETLTQLNKELMKEFGMRCYIDDKNKVVVTDVKGNIILTK